MSKALDDARRRLAPGPVEVAARMIVARTSGQISTHYADCHLYHLACFAVFVLENKEDR